MKKFLSALLLLSCFGGAPAQNPQAAPEAVVVVGNVRFTVLTPHLVRMEWSKDGRFEDHATLTMINRRLAPPAFRLRNTRSTLEIRTSALTLRYRKTGRFSPENLQVRFRLGDTERIWRPGDADTANLLGTARTLDRANGYKLAEPLEKGILSRDGWAVVDDSKRHLLLPDSSAWGEWVAPRPVGERQDWYLFAYGHDYKQALYDYSLVAGRSPTAAKVCFRLLVEPLLAIFGQRTGRSGRTDAQP